MPSKKKKYNARFPPARIKKIMQMDEDVGKVAATVPVIISRALELFIESLIQQATQTTLLKNAKTLSTSHIKQTIESQERYKFLRELVASIPDHQIEEEAAPGSSSSNNSNYNNAEEGAAAVKRPRGRPRKPKDDAASVPKRGRGKRKREESSQSSESEDSEEMIIKEDSEETEDAEDESDDEPANIAPNTSLSISSSSAFGASLTTTAAVAARNGSPKTVTACDGQQSSHTTTTLTKPPPLSLLLGHQQSRPQHHHQLYQQQQQEPLHHQQFQQQQQQYAAASSLPSPMMPAAMPGMYQRLTGMAPAHMYNWPGPSTSLPSMMPHGFPALAAPQSHYSGMGGFSSAVGLAGLIYAGIPAAHMHGYPMQPVAGSGVVGMYRGDVGPVGSVGYPGMPAKHSPSISAHGEDGQAEDDYDT